MYINYVHTDTQPILSSCASGCINRKHFDWMSTKYLFQFHHPLPLSPTFPLNQMVTHFPFATAFDLRWPSDDDRNHRQMSNIINRSNKSMLYYHKKMKMMKMWQKQINDFLSLRCHHKPIQHPVNQKINGEGT